MVTYELSSLYKFTGLLKELFFFFLLRSMVASNLTEKLEHSAVCGRDQNMKRLRGLNTEEY